MDDAREVYVVQAGYDSDQSVYGVYTDRATAQAAARMLSDAYGSSDYAYATAHALDEAADPIRAGYRPYLVQVDGNGNVFDVEPFDFRWDRGRTEIWARDPDHARTVVGERVARLKADGRWPDGWDG